MEVPLALGQTARDWDEQQLDLQAAAGQVAAAPTGGFTGRVVGAASRFVTAWQRHAGGLATEAEGHADALRTVLTDYLTTDGAVAGDHALLGEHLGELR